MAHPTDNADGERFMDDRDRSIKYANVWYNSTGKSDFKNTQMFTGIAGSSATVNFTGTGIGVYGTIYVADTTTVAPISHYTIDSGEPHEYIAVRQPYEQYQQKFFRISNLELTQHTLVITNIVSNGWLCLDFFSIETSPVEPTTTPLDLPAASAASSSTSTALSSAASAPSSFVAGATSFKADAEPSTPGTSSSTAGASSSTEGAASSSADAVTVTATTRISDKRSGPPISATVGAAIAGFAIISLILYACFFFRRRRHRKKTFLLRPSDGAPPPPNPEASPARRQRPSEIAPFIITEQSNQSLTELSELDSIKVPLPAGGRQQVADLPPGYTVLPDGGRGRMGV